MSAHHFPCTAPVPKISAPLVLLNGWMMPNSLWQPLLPALQAIGDVILLDIVYDGAPDSTLTGVGLHNKYDKSENDKGEYDESENDKNNNGDKHKSLVDQVIAQITKQLPSQSVLLGWSLGGMLAARIAAQFPERVLGLVTLASNVQFVADQHYASAMPEETFQHFYQSYQLSPEKTLQQFCGLVAQGDMKMREQRRYLKEQFAHKTTAESFIHLDGLLGLDLLRYMKNSDFLSPIQCPALHIFGENDQLVPLQLNSLESASPECIKSEIEPLELIKEWLQVSPLSRIEVIVGAGHLLHYPADRLLPMLEDFFLNKDEINKSENKKDETKAAIALSFSRAAMSYDQAAQVQQIAGERLLNGMAKYITQRNGVIADVGCGTGFFARALIQQYDAEKFIGIDLAQGMLDVAAQRHADITIANWQQGDAESLPLADQSVDMIYANFSLQWCENLPALMADFFRVLKPSGYCCFTSLASQTLYELRQAWSAIDQYDHVNPFYGKEHWLPVIQAQGFSIVHQDEYQEQSLYTTPMAVLRSLKAIGANVVKGERSMALTGKRKLEALLAELEQYRTDQGIPATYVINEWILAKPSA